MMGIFKNKIAEELLRLILGMQHGINQRQEVINRAVEMRLKRLEDMQKALADDVFGVKEDDDSPTGLGIDEASGTFGRFKI